MTRIGHDFTRAMYAPRHLGIQAKIGVVIDDLQTNRCQRITTYPSINLVSCEWCDSVICEHMLRIHFMSIDSHVR